MKVENKVKFIVNAVKWFDRINGNTYHSVKVLDTESGKTYCDDTPYQYGYGDSYRQTALGVMLNNGLLPKKYSKDNLWLYERENDYPIYWSVSEGLKREMIANGTV